MLFKRIWPRFWKKQRSSLTEWTGPDPAYDHRWDDQITEYFLQRAFSKSDQGSSLRVAGFGDPFLHTFNSPMPERFALLRRRISLTFLVFHPLIGIMVWLARHQSKRALLSNSTIDDAARLDGHCRNLLDRIDFGRPMPTAVRVQLLSYCGAGIVRKQDIRSAVMYGALAVESASWRGCIRVENLSRSRKIARR